jgi:hypothetical protein
LKLAQANSSGDPISKNPSHKRAGGVAQVVKCLACIKVLNSNSQYCKKKKTIKNLCSVRDPIKTITKRKLD